MLWLVSHLQDFPLCRFTSRILMFEAQFLQICVNISWFPGRLITKAAELMYFTIKAVKTWTYFCLLNSSSIHRKCQIFFFLSNLGFSFVPWNYNFDTKIFLRFPFVAIWNLFSSNCWQCSLNIETILLLNN